MKIIIIYIVAPTNEIIDQNKFNLVVIKTLTVWSKAEHTERPILSKHQSKPVIGWLDSVQFCTKFSSPATPIGIPSPSLSCLLSG